MKLTKTFLTIFSGIILSLNVSAQTTGNLDFSFTPISHPSYSGNRSVMAVWIQTNTGTFVKTRLRNAGGGTSDHLPTWAVNSGGPASNCMSSSCNKVSAVTGATLTSFSAKTITWDGTDVNGNVVADGTYQITIQETWNHGGSGTATRSFTFQKGPASDVQTPASDANFNAINLAWNPSSAGLNELGKDNVSIYPNPSNDGIFNVTYSQATSISVVNMLGIEVIAEQVLITTNGSKSIDLSNCTNGIYFVTVKNGPNTRNYRVVLNK